MSRAFLTRSPNPAELTLLKKFLGTYRDGTGNNREDDGTSRADSRQIERCFAELLHGKTTENKAYYDFVVEFNEGGGVAVRGASIKSKELQKLRAFTGNGGELRAHLELSNASATDWRMCTEAGLTKDQFLAHERPEAFGEVILERQKVDRLLSQKNYLAKVPGEHKWFVDTDCVFISVLYSPMQKSEREYLISSFSTQLPKPKTWVFRKLSLVGLDASGGVLYEWYALSGSQLKYYPLISSRVHGTKLFTPSKPTVENLRAKAARLFGD